MLNCQNCGNPLSEGTVFCGKCGVLVSTAPSKRVCSNCKSEIEEGMFFCNHCGTKYDFVPAVNERKEVRGAERPGQFYTQSRTITIKRETQFVCVANTYRVMVDGNIMGNIAAGKTLTMTVQNETAVVEIVCTTMMINKKIKMVLRLGNNPQVNFKVQWPGDIIASVQGADIIEKSY